MHIDLLYRQEDDRQAMYLNPLVLDQMNHSAVSECLAGLVHYLPHMEMQPLKNICELLID
jgi:hypothetical protein